MATQSATAMSTPPGFNGPPDQASLSTSRSRLSIVATLRRRTSRLLGRKGTAAAGTADNTPQAIQPKSLKSKRSWFQSVGARFHRHDHTLLESSESSQGIQVELEETSRSNTNLPSSPEISPPPSPTRRRLFRSRHLRLHSLPARFRRRGAALFSRSSSLSDEDKENFLTLPAAPVHASNTGSWSSFRSGVQKAVREIVDGNFRFSEDRSPRSSAPTSRPPPRVPLRTLWTIMSADSSEGQRQPNPAEERPQEKVDQHPPKKYQLSSPTWSPDWSPPSSSPPTIRTTTTYVAVSPSPSLSASAGRRSGDGDGSDNGACCCRSPSPSPSPGALTRSGSTAESSPVVTPPRPISPASVNRRVGRGSVLEVVEGEGEGDEEDGVEVWTEEDGDEDMNIGLGVLRDVGGAGGNGSVWGDEAVEGEGGNGGYGPGENGREGVVSVDELMRRGVARPRVVSHPSGVV